MKRILLFLLISIILSIDTIEARDSTFYNKQNIREYGRNKIESVDDMVKIFYGKQIYIYVPSITNKTNSINLPSDISSMVRSLFNSTGNSITLLSYVNRNNLPKEEVFIINGAITAFDIDGESTENGLQLSGEGKKAEELASISMKDNKNRKITKLGITFNPSNAKTGFYISRTSTSNTIDIQETSDSDATTYSILGVVIDSKDRSLESDGVHHSLRVLIEVSTIEVLGRLVKYPYWLLTKTEINPDIFDYLVKEFIRDSLNEKLKKISYLLSLKDGSLEVTSTINSQLREAIINYKREHGLAPNDIISSRLYKSLLGA